MEMQMAQNDQNNVDKEPGGGFLLCDSRVYDKTNHQNTMIRQFL